MKPKDKSGENLNLNVFFSANFRKDCDDPEMTNDTLERYANLVETSKECRMCDFRAKSLPGHMTHITDEHVITSNPDFENRKANMVNHD